VNSLVKDAQKAGERVGLKSDQIVITGGNPLKGRIRVRGAKNLATKAMVAALLGETTSVLRDVPDISDVEVVRGLLEVYGVVVTSTVAGELRFDTSNVERAHFAEIDAHAGSSRIPILFCGPLLHRLGEARIPDLGGCRIGDRPIDFHLDVLRKFGAVVEKQESGIRMSAPNGLKGAKLELPYPSVGATEQVLLTAVRAEGITELKGAAIEPEIMDLIAILQKMGAIINVEPNRVIFIEGVERLTGYTHRALFDRNEAASWASAALATEGDIFVGGPAEVSYYAQITPLHDLLGIPLPRVALRGHALVAPKRMMRFIERYSISAGEIFASADDLLAEREPKDVAAIRRQAETARKELMKHIERIGELALPADHALARAINRSIGHIEYHFNKLTERSIRALVRKDKERYAAAKELLATLYPDRHVQDRVVGWFPYWLQQGRGLVDLMIDEIAPDADSFSIIGV